MNPSNSTGKGKPFIIRDSVNCCVSTQEKLDSRNFYKFNLPGFDMQSPSCHGTIEFGRLSSYFRTKRRWSEQAVSNDCIQNYM